MSEEGMEIDAHTSKTPTETNPLMALEETAETISGGIGHAEAAWPVLLTAVKTLKNMAGPKLGVEIFDKFAALSKTEVFKQISNFKPYQVARIALALGCAAGPSAVSQEDLVNALQSVQASSRVEMQLRAKEFAPYKHEKGHEAVQHFVDDIRPHVEEIQKLFGGNSTPAEQRALRYFFSDVLAPDGNRISSEGLEDVEDEEISPNVILPGYKTLMTQMLGSPLGLDDLLTQIDGPEHQQGDSVSLAPELNEDQTPKQFITENPRDFRSPEYKEMKKRFFEIAFSPAGKAMRSRIGGPESLLLYEALIDPDLAPPELVAEAKERMSLGRAMNLVNPKTTKAT